MAIAAFQVVHTDDAWHKLLAKHFRPKSITGQWNLGPPSNGSLQPELPSTRFRMETNYRNRSRLQDPYVREDSSWQRIESPMMHLYPTQEGVVKSILALIESSEDTILWRTKEGKDSFENWLSSLFYQQSTIKNVSEELLLTHERTQRLIRPWY